MTTTRITFAVALTLIQATGAHAGKLVVAAYGVDAPDCGAKIAPCRSISQAIANADPGDTIEVGPGRYGDLDGNGAVGPGDEAMLAGVAIRVTKPLRIVSRDGSGVTVIDASGVQAGVGIYSSGVVLGARKRGFTITGASSWGAFCDTAVRDVRIEGNWARGNYHGFLASGERVSVIGNRAIANEDTGFVIGATESYVADNVAIANRQGIFARGADSTLAGNVVSANGPSGTTAGIYVRARTRLEGNVVSGNRGTGIGIFADGDGTRVVGNRIAGNTGIGIEIGGGQPVGDLVVTRNDVLGNNVLRSPGGAENCGLANGTGSPLAAPANYWGAAGGPGSDPADATCGNAVVIEPVAAKSFRIRAKAAR